MIPNPITYEVTADVSIAGNEVLKVIPDSVFEVGSINKDPIEVTISQDKTEWVWNESGVVANRELDCGELSAGIWEGTFSFTISLEETSTTSTSNAGAYAIDGTRLATWDELVEMGLDIENDSFFDNNDFCSISRINSDKLAGTTKVVIPEGVTDISNEAFCNCEDLKEIILPNTLEYIGEFAFKYCKSLESITIPSSVMVVDDGIFCGCTNLSNVTIETGKLTCLSYRMFESCENLTEIIIPNNINNINVETFAECPNLTTIYYNGDTTNAPWGATNATVETYTE